MLSRPTTVMTQIFVASSNRHKLAEFQAIATHHNLVIKILPELNGADAPPETGSTFEENALLKAKFYSSITSPLHWVLADDSGLEVSALQNAPGVRSARYAFDPATGADPSSDRQNNEKLLSELALFPSANRSARFVCVISAAQNGAARGVFRGELRGDIVLEARGSNGFGYDPLFLVPSLKKTLAELSAEEKLRVSHRGTAFRKFIQWFEELN